MVVLAIDPGTRYAGYSVVRCEGGRISVLEVDVLKLTTSASLAHRLREFYTFFNAKIAEQKICSLALETPFLGKNAQNFLKLGYVRGLLYLLSDMHGLALYEYAPREIKKSVTGYGGADKEQVARALSVMFPGFATPVLLDASDALALALCCAWHVGL